MTTVLYDGSFDGLLSAIFEIYEYKLRPVAILPKDEFVCRDFFSEEHDTSTNMEKSERVKTRIKKNLPGHGLSTILRLYLSENPDREMLIYHLISESVAHPGVNILENYASPKILEIAKIIKSVGRETHRMNAFVRFEKLQDDSFFAKIEPDFNVLPLISNHFKNRYRDQKWMIFDLKRNYGIYWNLQELDLFYPEKQLDMYDSEKYHHEEEWYFQQMWQRYFIKTGIESRRNPKLHIQHVPKRYWKYLTEKNILG